MNDPIPSPPIPIWRVYGYLRPGGSTAATHAIPPDGEGPRLRDGESILGEYEAPDARQACAIAEALAGGAPIPDAPVWVPWSEPVGPARDEIGESVADPDLTRWAKPVSPRCGSGSGRVIRGTRSLNS